MCFEMDRIYSQMHAQAMEIENLHYYDLILKIWVTLIFQNSWSPAALSDVLACSLMVLYQSTQASYL